MNAIIKDNIPYCPKCDNEVLGNLTGEYNLVEHEGKHFVKFQRFCNGSCHGKYDYYVDITMSDNKRHSFSNVKEVKEDEVKREN